MKKLLSLFLVLVLTILFMACIDDVNYEGEKTYSDMEIIVSDGQNTIKYKLNESDAAKSLYDQLPLTVEVANFSNNEKIFYPSKKLEVTNSPNGSGGVGVLAYYEPWGDVVMFYDNFRTNSSLYILGEAIENKESVQFLNGTIVIEKID